MKLLTQVQTKLLNLEEQNLEYKRLRLCAEYEKSCGYSGSDHCPAQGAV